MRRSCCLWRPPLLVVCYAEAANDFFALTLGIVETRLVHNCVVC